jgi:uncharacterized DUF497 family protein
VSPFHRINEFVVVCLLKLPKVKCSNSIRRFMAIQVISNTNLYVVLFATRAYLTIISFVLFK